MALSSCCCSKGKPIFHFISARCWLHQAQQRRQLRSLLLQKTVKKGQGAFLWGSCFLTRYREGATVRQNSAPAIQGHQLAFTIESRGVTPGRKECPWTSWMDCWSFHRKREESTWNKIQPRLILEGCAPMQLFGKHEVMKFSCQHGPA